MQEKIKSALLWRYATKVFDPSKPVAKEELDAIIEAGHIRPPPTSPDKGEIRMPSATLSAALL